MFITSSEWNKWSGKIIILFDCFVCKDYNIYFFLWWVFTFERIKWYLVNYQQNLFCVLFVKKIMYMLIIYLLHGTFTETKNIVYFYDNYAEYKKEKE